MDMELEYAEMKMREFSAGKLSDEQYFSRASSASKDPGVLGPIVWDLKRKRTVEGIFESFSINYLEKNKILTFHTIK